MNKLNDLMARILLAAIFFMSGVGKMSAYAATQGYMESQGVPGMLLPLVIGFEILLPVLLVIGWQTRYAALALAGFSIVTGLMFHFDFGDQMQSIMFMKNLAMAGGFLLLFIHGAGELSLDSKLNKSLKRNL